MSFTLGHLEATWRLEMSLYIERSTQNTLADCLMKNLHCYFPEFPYEKTDDNAIARVS